MQKVPNMRAIVACAVAIAAAATTGAAQKPQTRRTATVVGHLGTPALLPFDAGLARRLRAPAGFKVSLFSQGLGSPRLMAVGPDGSIYVTRRDSGDVLAIPAAGGEARKVATDLPNVHGIAVAGARVYLATIHEVYVADARPDGSLGTPRAIITDLPDAGQHANRTLGIGPDGMLYITVGSTCNTCVEPNEENATVLRARPDGSQRVIFARGLRNTIGFGWHPTTGEMWGLDHGSDWHGDNTPPEELNQLQASANYGWPFCYGNKTPDATFASEPRGSTKAEYCPRTVAPTISYQAHSAPIQMAFYTASQFPAEYRNDAFVAMRGSWNREPPTGYKIVRIRFRDGKPVAMDDFLTGFLTSGAGSYFGRPAGVVVARDGSLLVSDDTNGAIYRVSY